MAFYKAIVLLLVLLPFESTAQPQGSPAQIRMKQEVEVLKAQATKDDRGMVTPQEYGRLLIQLIEATHYYQRVPKIQTVVDKFVSTLIGPQNPDNLINELGPGAFSEFVRNTLLAAQKSKPDL
jgi:hypothetical protein